MANKYHMQTELSKKEIFFYSTSIILGIILIAFVTPKINFQTLNANGEKVINTHLIIFIILASILCYILHFRKMALWIVGVKLQKTTSTTRWIMDDCIAYAALFIQGTACATWILAGASFAFQVYLLADALIKREKARKKLLTEGKTLPAFPVGQILYAFTNPFNKIIMLVPAGLLYEALNGNAPLCSAKNIIAVAVMLITYFSIACLISSITIVLRQRRPLENINRIFTDHYSEITTYILMLCPLGLMLALIYTKEPIAIILLIIPFIAMHRAMKNIEVIFDEYKDFLYSLAYAIDARDHYTYGHSERVAKYSAAIASYMNLPLKHIEDIEKAGKIHDLGKIIIPDSILHKPGKLDDDEYTVMKTHINTLKTHFEDKKRLSEALPIDIASSHHERFDGKGYVIGKKGDDIPLGGRILCVADVFDALTTDRPYRKGMSPEIALSYIKDGSGSHFDPKIVTIFEKMFHEGLIVQLMLSEKNT